MKCQHKTLVLIIGHSVLVLGVRAAKLFSYSKRHRQAKCPNTLNNCFQIVFTVTSPPLSMSELEVETFELDAVRFTFSFGCWRASLWLSQRIQLYSAVLYMWIQLKDNWGDCRGYSVISTDLFLPGLDEKISSEGKEENTQFEEEHGLIC